MAAVRKRLLTCWLCLGVGCLSIADARAEVVPWLYDVEVVVPDQQVETRAEAAGAALLQLLSRLTGLAELPENETVSQALQNPELYYNGVGYVERQRTTDDGELVEELRLRVRFDPRAMLRLVKESGLPIWRSDRPRVLAWVVVETPQGRTIVGAEDPSDFVAALLERARQRGVPLVLPLLDLEDQIAVEPAAVWGRLPDVLQPASQRYQADLLLVGRAEQLTGGIWAMGWELWINDEQVRFDSRNRDPLVLGGEAADFVANELAARLAVQGEEARGIRFAVRDVLRPEDYGHLLRYLNRFEIIDDVAVTQVRDHQVDIFLTTRADVTALLRMFDVDRRLTELEVDGLSGYDAELSWRP